MRENISKSLGGKTLFHDLDIVLSPGSRIGLLGLNGSGKTTLLRVLNGELQPDTGSVSCAPGLQAVTFDQDREQLDTSLTLYRALAPQGDTVIYRDRPIHVATWGKRFLFKHEQLTQPVSSLSGGEQARILIAQLMLRPADILFLDEPTNNLDIQTLEVLEESLLEFPGAVVLISHDRYLLDRVSTSVLGLDGGGECVFYADYPQWEEARVAREKAAAVKSKPRKQETVCQAQKGEAFLQRAARMGEHRGTDPGGRRESRSLSDRPGRSFRSDGCARIAEADGPVRGGAAGSGYALCALGGTGRQGRPVARVLAVAFNPGCRIS